MNKTVKYFFSALSISAVCLLISCADDPIRHQCSDCPEATSYLPLQVGNYWNFATKGPSLATSSDGIHREIIGTTTVGQNEYFVMVTSNSSDYKDSVYIRIDENSSYVYAKRRSDPHEYVMFKLDATAGDQWTYPVDDRSTMRVTVGTDSVQTAHAIIQHCKSYFYDVDMWADEEHTELLSKGIGFVKSYSNAWGMSSTITSARINGVTHSF